MRSFQPFPPQLMQQSGARSTGVLQVLHHGPENRVPTE
jgi:hypothetical protein